MCPANAVFAAALAAAVATGGCGTSGERRAQMSQPDHGPAVSDAPDCDSLIREPTFAPDAEVLVEHVSGRERGCTIEVPANSPVLERLAIKADCPPKASVIVPLDDESDGWHVDHAELRELDNGYCVPR